MRRLIKKNLIDCSDDSKFCFSIFCPECKQVWKSTPIRFSKAKKDIYTKEKQIIIQTLYQLEKEQALEYALDEAVRHFNYCPLCRRLVCNHCFIICEDLDMCIMCANNLHEQGQAVMHVDILD